MPFTSTRAARQDGIRLDGVLPAPALANAEGSAMFTSSDVSPIRTSTSFGPTDTYELEGSKPSAPESRYHPSKLIGRRAVSAA